MSSSSSNNNDDSFSSPSPMLMNDLEMMAKTVTDQLLLGDNYDFDQHSSTTQATNTVPFIIVGVIVGVCFIFVAYILVQKLMCKDSATGVPLSAFTSKFQGKLKSSSSIKTVKSNEVQSAYPPQPTTTTAKPIASSGASTAKKAPSKAGKLPSKAPPSKAAAGARKGSRI